MAVNLKKEPLVSIPDLCVACAEFRELQRLAEEIAAEMDAIKERIKSAMGNNVEVVAGEYKISNKPVTSSRLDTKSLKHDLPDVAARYMVESVSTRFLIR